MAGIKKGGIKLQNKMENLVLHILVVYGSYNSLINCLSWHGISIYCYFHIKGNLLSLNDKLQDWHARISSI